MIVSWLAAALMLFNVIISILIIIKISKQEKFQTSEAHANLELINQSLNRLSEIAEKLEQKKNVKKHNGEAVRKVSEESSNANKENQALTLIRRGENPHMISKKLGISRSEVDLLIASEKLGKGKRMIGVEA